MVNTAQGGWCLDGESGYGLTLGLYVFLNLGFNLLLAAGGAGV